MRGSVLKGIVTLGLMVLNIVFWVPVLMVAALLKLVIPSAGWRRWMSRLMTRLAEAWIDCNGAIFRLMGVLQTQVHGLEGLSPDQWYLVVSNHRSWVDILVLQQTLTHRVPFLKFFLKQQLIWVPFLGLAWWALDFPFMRRYSAEYLAQHPEARGRDLAATRKACAKFAAIPTSVMNFVEGTRYTAAKHARSQSPYRHLLPPRAGGIAFVLSAMGGVLHSLLDVTIAYRDPAPTLWDMCCGRLQPVTIELSARPIEPWSTVGDYSQDELFRRRFQQWLAALWSAKDARLEQLLAAGDVR